MPLRIDEESMNKGCDAGKAIEMRLALLFGGHGRLRQKTIFVWRFPTT